MSRGLLFIGFLLLMNGVAAQAQKNVLLLDQWTDTTITPGLEEAIFNDLWTFNYRGTNYCAFGSSQGTHLFQVGDEKLEFLAFQPGRFQSPYVEHRDFKTYQNYLYGVCDEGTSSLQIFDLSYLPDSLPKVYDSALHFQICHNIYIDTVKAKLYACGPNNMGMQVFSLANPANPELELVFDNVAYVHDCYVRNDTAFLNCGFDGLQVYDFGTPIPQQLGLIDFYPNQGYNHSGWLSPAGDVYAFIDETQGTRIKLCEWDGNLSSISIRETFGTKDFEDYVPHNIILLDYLAFVSYYNEGLRIYDLSERPIREIGAYDTFEAETAYRLNGAWGVGIFPEKNQVLIADRQNGLFLFSFPIDLLNRPGEGTVATNIPLMDANGYLIPRDYLKDEGISFSIVAMDGRMVYEQANFLSYLNIPLNLAAGTYAYAIYDAFGERVEQGKFIKAR